MKLNIHGVDATMRQRINEMLDRIEREHEVKVLFACELGSRGWGLSPQLATAIAPVTSREVNR